MIENTNGVLKMTGIKRVVFFADMEAGAIRALQSHPVGSGIYLRTKCIFGKNPQDVIDRNSGIIRNLA
ncbi:MAG: hypothetical protein M9904_00030 [Chitinophagaceae bacterium]|nr:hypothetical protein [Chitinophagaceae bacterium]